MTFDPVTPVDPYAGDNLRFRKAMIRERLAGIKIERDALIAEREAIAQKQGSSGAEPPHKASDATLQSLNEGLAKAQKKRFGWR